MSENCQTEEDADRAYLRFKGAGHLDISSLQVLRALASWRERTARSRNLARGFVVSDAALLQLAKKKPRNDSELDSVADLHPRAAGRYGNVLLATINQHRDSTAPIERLLPLDAQQRRKLEAMRRLVQKEAHVLQVDPAILASKKQLEALMREYESEGTVPDRLSGWREPVITRKLLPLISGPGTAQR